MFMKPFSCLNIQHIYILLELSHSQFIFCILNIPNVIITSGGGESAEAVDGELEHAVPASSSDALDLESVVHLAGTDQPMEQGNTRTMPIIIDINHQFCLWLIHNGS